MPVEDGLQAKARAVRRHCRGRVVGDHAGMFSCGTWPTLSQVSVVYGSLTMAIVILFSLDGWRRCCCSALKVIAQYERFGLEPQDAPKQPIKTGSVFSQHGAARPKRCGADTRIRRFHSSTLSGIPMLDEALIENSLAAWHRCRCEGNAKTSRRSPNTPPGCARFLRARACADCLDAAKPRGRYRVRTRGLPQAASAFRFCAR